jgi:RNA polymerase sigma-70 factor, ECF subfamily
MPREPQAPVLIPLLAIPSDDIRLMVLVAGRDGEALALICARFSRPLFSLAMSIVRSHAAAEDIQQDVFNEIWKRAPEYRASLGTPFSWIMTMTRHKAIDRLRLEIRRARQIVELEALDYSAEPVPRADDKAILERERRVEVRAAVDGLAILERQAVELAYYDGLTCAEIAGRLYLPLGTVKARVRRGLRHLQHPLRLAR